MPTNDPDIPRFEEKTAPKALLAAMQQLCQNLDRQISEMENMSLLEAYELAVTVDGENLPDYWKNWYAWQQESKIEMGDL